MWGSDVTGWTTIEHGDKWVTEKTVNKKVMIFIPEGDRNGGSVFLTLIDGLSIRISFDYDEYNNLPPKEAGWDDSYQIKILKKPIKKYTQPTIDMFLLKDNQKEYFS